MLATLPMWQILLQTAHFRDGDIFCPQYAVGAQWTKPQYLRKVWEMYAAAVETCPAELHLWANCECMTVARKTVPLMPPATVESENSPVTLDRLIWQMQTASDYCESIITFSFNHYYSPQTGNAAYFDSYLAYLANGCTPETIPPSAPKHVRTEGDLLLWDAAEDNIGVAYYLGQYRTIQVCGLRSKIFRQVVQKDRRLADASQGILVQHDENRWGKACAANCAVLPKISGLNLIFSGLAANITMFADFCAETVDI